MHDQTPLREAGAVLIGIITVAAAILNINDPNRAMGLAVVILVSSLAVASAAIYLYVKASNNQLRIWASVALALGLLASSSSIISMATSGEGAASPNPRQALTTPTTTSSPPNGLPASNTTPSQTSESASLTPEKTSGPTTSSIASPEDGAEVAQSIKATGVVGSLVPSSDRLVLMLLVADVNRFYPETVEVHGTTWSSDIEIGGGGDAGKQYELTLVDLDPTGMQHLDAYGAAQAKNGGPLGIPRDEMVRTWGAHVLAVAHITRLKQ